MRKKARDSEVPVGEEAEISQCGPNCQWYYWLGAPAMIKVARITFASRLTDLERRVTPRAVGACSSLHCYHRRALQLVGDSLLTGSFGDQ